MLAFIDESGDTGRRYYSSSSPYFVVSLVIFPDDQQARLYQHQIELFKQDLGKDHHFEFHFSKNNPSVRKAFLREITNYNFKYYAVVIDKNPDKLFGQVFNQKDSFYSYVFKMLLINARPYLNQAQIILDKSGPKSFQLDLEQYLLTNINSPRHDCVANLRQKDSSKDNLLQVADYVSGAINRKYNQKKDWHQYYRYLQPREAYVQQWPR